MQSSDGITRLGTSGPLTDFWCDAGLDLIIVTVPACAEDRVMPIFYKLFRLRADIRVSALNSMLRHNGFIGRDGEA